MALGNGDATPPLPRSATARFLLPLSERERERITATAVPLVTQQYQIIVQS